MENIILKLIELQNQIKLLHWQTNSYARHKAYDEIYSKLNDLIDEFVEVYQGKYPKVKFDSINIELKNVDELQLNDYVGEIVSMLVEDLPKKLDEYDFDLLAIRDEILALTHKFKYLCTLK